MTVKAETIWRGAEQLSVELADGPTAATLELLRGTVWGGGRLRYRILDVESKLSRMTDPWFLTLTRAGETVAVCVLNRRETRLLGRPCDSFHLAMLATAPQYMGRGYARLLIERAVDLCRARLSRRGVAYAYIEAATDRSLRIAESFRPVVEATLRMTVFSRFAPRDDARVGKLAEEERPEIVERLAALYGSHIFDDFESSVRAADYHVLRDGGEIVAGAQAETLRWSVTRLPGALGWLTLNLPRIAPPLRRFLDPADLRILRLGNLLAAPGREDALLALMESLLARNRAPVAMFLLDQRTPLLDRIRSRGGLGALNLAVGEATAALLVYAQGFDDAEISALRARAALMSPLDVF